MKVVDLTWTDDAAAYDAAPGSRLYAQLSIAGCPMHVNAYEVREEDGLQVAADETWQPLLDGIGQADGADGAYQTAEINGRTYVIVALPFCE